MGSAHLTVLPVVSRGNVRILLGLVTLAEVLAAYGVEDVGEIPVSERLQRA